MRGLRTACNSLNHITRMTQSVFRKTCIYLRWLCIKLWRWCKSHNQLQDYYRSYTMMCKFKGVWAIMLFHRFSSDLQRQLVSHYWTDSGNNWIWGKWLALVINYNRMVVSNKKVHFSFEREAGHRSLLQLSKTVNPYFSTIAADIFYWFPIIKAFNSGLTLFYTIYITN